MKYRIKPNGPVTGVFIPETKETKQCGDCKKTLPLWRFHLSGKGDKRRAICSDCARERKKTYRRGDGGRRKIYRTKAVDSILSMRW